MRSTMNQVIELRQFAPDAKFVHHRVGFIIRTVHHTRMPRIVVNGNASNEIRSVHIVNWVKVAGKRLVLSNDDCYRSVRLKAGDALPPHIFDTYDQALESVRDEWLRQNTPRPTPGGIQGGQGSAGSASFSEPVPEGV